MKLFLAFLLVSSYAWASDATGGNQVDAIIRDTTPLYEDSEVCARVSEIGQKVVTASGNPAAYSFRFYVLNSPDATTFSALHGRHSSAGGAPDLPLFVPGCRPVNHWGAHPARCQACAKARPDR